MGLNERQKAFAEFYATSLNATEAAKKAGYSTKTAYSQGQRLLKNVEIQNYVKNHTLKARNERIANSNEILEYLTETMRDAEEARRERTKAAELLGKRYGLFEEAKKPNGDEDEGLKIIVERKIINLSKDKENE